MRQPWRDDGGEPPGGSALGILAWTWAVPGTARPQWRVSWLVALWMLFDAVAFAQGGAWPLLPAAIAVPALTLMLHTWTANLVGRGLDLDRDQVVVGVFGDAIELGPEARPGRQALLAAAGPAASLLIGLACLLAAGLPIAAWFSWTTLIFPFFSAAGTAVGLGSLGAGTGAQLLVYAGLLNAALGLINLLPLPGLDGARLWRAALWPAIGRGPACRAAVIAAAAVCAAWAVFGLIYQQWMLVILAIMWGAAAWRQWRAMADGFDPVLLLPMETGGGSWFARWRARRAAERIAAEERRQDEEQALLDRLLAKVSEHGLPSLTAAERRQLHAISKRQRERAGVGGEGG